VDADAAAAQVRRAQAVPAGVIKMSRTEHLPAAGFSPDGILWRGVTVIAWISFAFRQQKPLDGNADEE